MTRSSNKFLALAMIVTLLASGLALPVAAQGPDAAISFTILHTNDFHGQLEPSGSNPGMARTAKVVNDVRAAVGTDNVLLVDAGDQMQGSLLSNLSKGAATIETFKAMGYTAATFGNHEFDWGLETLYARIGQAAPVYPYVTANIVPNPTLADCSTVSWPATLPDGFPQPYVVKTVGTAPNQVKVAFVGVTTQEVPTITIATATQGLCFKDPADSILRYYAEMKAQADVIVVLSHLGLKDGGYGYGIPVYGDRTLAQKLIDAGKPVPLIIGGHEHVNMLTLTPPGAVVIGGKTTIGQAYYNGRQLGQADLTFDPATGATTVAWKTNAVSTTGEKDPTIDALIQSYASDPAYQALINTPVGYAQTDLLRNYNGDSMMGNFIDDAIYGALNNDATATNDVDLFFNNAGGIRTDWCDKEDPVNPGTYIWSSAAADCAQGVWSHDPMLLNYGQMFTILPFGNATVVGDMTGAEILDVLNQSATLGKGAIQPAGLRYKFYSYADANPGPQPWAWGAFDACVVNKTTQACEPLNLNKTYRVGTNEFLAPAGGDNYSGFKYMKNITYWGDMLNAVNAWVATHFTQATPYKGPNGDGNLDGRITRVGTNNGGDVVPVTILHHNDSHGRLYKTSSAVGYTQLATLIGQERVHNPTRTLLLQAGDQIQGDAMMAFYKAAPLGYGSDGTPLPAELQLHPMMAVMNALKYDAWTLGNHEFNFGNEIFKAVLKQSDAPVLQANVEDDGRYGIAEVPVESDVQVTLPGPAGDIKVAVLGIGNHRIAQYELPSNIPGLTFTDPIAVAQTLAPPLKATNDAVIALTHIGFTADPKSVEVDDKVDTNLAAVTTGIDAIVGGHSHTNPSTGSDPYKYLPAIVSNPNNVPVIINHAYRYNTYLGTIVLGLLPKAEGGYEVVSRAGRYIQVTSTTTEDAALRAVVEPYIAFYNSYINTVIGQTTVPIDALKAFTEETNAANLQADASVWALTKNNMAPDVHLSGAMTNRKIADAATPDNPATLTVNDMFSLMPYENSLLVLSMNGPQLKNVLERAYRNYYYYKYVPGYGGYSYYTTCMIATDKVGQITYWDKYPELPNGNNVLALRINGQAVDFTDAAKYYKVSTVNYLAAGSCNFNDGGVSLWPLDQIAYDTQYYVRDVVIDYIKAQTGPISPAIEGRLRFSPPLAVVDMNATITQAPAPGLVTLGSDIDVHVKALNIGTTTNAFFFVPLSPKVAYVPDSAYGGAYPVTAGAAAGLAAKYGKTSLAVPEGAVADTIIGVAYEAPGLSTGGTVDFGFHVQVTASDGKVDHFVVISTDGKLFKTIQANSISLAAQDMAAFPALADTYIHSGMPMDNYGGSPQLYTRVGAAGNDYQRVLLGFDVTSIKPEYLVEKAVLSVYLNGTSGGAVDGQLQAHEMTTAWTENTATWKAPWVKPGGDFVETAVAGAPIDRSMVGTWISIDVTPLVTKWTADPASNLGVILRVRKVTSITGYRFASRAHWETEHRPKLEVTYRKP